MPNFDGTGPRNNVVGRGRGCCIKRNLCNNQANNDALADNNACRPLRKRDGTGPNCPRKTTTNNG